MTKWLLSIGLYFLSTSVLAATATSPILYQWTEFAPNNQMLQRVITTQATCPDTTMQITRPSSPDFPITICQKVVPAVSQFNPTKIVIIADTGCRIDKGTRPQNCDNPNKWPFAQIAKTAAAWKPDLVIHSGDYLYRAKQCPAGNKNCAGSPYGDNWLAWQADFFKPAQPLLSAAPWVFVRGNHEICKRAGQGWTRLLDPFNYKHCFDYSPVYSVDLGDTRLFMMDSSSANDTQAPGNLSPWFISYLQTVSKSTAKSNWIVTHKPFWFVFSENPLHRAVQSHVLNTLQAAWENVLPSNVDLLISGHVHRFEAISMSKPDRHPPQLIVGVSGTRLDKNLVNPNLAGIMVANQTITQGVSLNDFGFMTLEKQPDGKTWNAQLRDPYGKVLVNCVLQNQQLNCQQNAGVKNN